MENKYSRALFNTYFLIPKMWPVLLPHYVVSQESKKQQTTIFWCRECEQNYLLFKTLPQKHGIIIHYAIVDKAEKVSVF